ncbi:MAG: SDR family oxidoreductase [Candidatus Hydrogenedentota bacterium]
MPPEMTNVVAWVTGAGSGIGRACAIALAEAGMRVALSGRRVDRLEAVASEIAQRGGTTHVEPLDVSHSGAVDASASLIRDRFGPIGVLVYSAGTNQSDRRWSDTSPSSWRSVTNTNLDGAFYCCRAVLPHMRERGDGLIITVSSWAGHYPSLLAGVAYSSTKAALNVLTETINMEEGRHNIRACAIAPAEVNTEILERRPEPVPQTEREFMLQPEDIGGIVRYLAELPPHVCVNSLIVSPTWNRPYHGPHRGVG